jgi:hypothetical protein
VSAGEGAEGPDGGGGAGGGAGSGGGAGDGRGGGASCAITEGRLAGAKLGAGNAEGAVARNTARLAAVMAEPTMSTLPGGGT